MEMINRNEKNGNGDRNGNGNVDLGHLELVGETAPGSRVLLRGLQLLQHLDQTLTGIENI